MSYLKFIEKPQICSNLYKWKTTYFGWSILAKRNFRSFKNTHLIINSIEINLDLDRTENKSYDDYVIFKNERKNRAAFRDLFKIRSDSFQRNISEINSRAFSTFTTWKTSKSSWIIIISRKSNRTLFSICEFSERFTWRHHIRSMSHLGELKWILNKNLTKICVRWT